MLALLLVVLIGVHTRATILIPLLVGRHHVLSTIVVGSTVHVRSEIGALIVIGLTSFDVATTTILLLLPLVRLGIIEVLSGRIELLCRWLKTLLRCKRRCTANWKWLLLTLEWLTLRLLLRLLWRRRLESRRRGRE